MCCIQTCCLSQFHSQIPVCDAQVLLGHTNWTNEFFLNSIRNLNMGPVEIKKEQREQCEAAIIAGLEHLTSQQSNHGDSPPLLLPLISAPINTVASSTTTTSVSFAEAKQRYTQEMKRAALQENIFTAADLQCSSLVGVLAGGPSVCSSEHSHVWKATLLYGLACQASKVGMGKKLRDASRDM